jgi:hypothetical protein
LSILIELENSIKYLRCGLAELQKITPENDFYEPPLLYLSSGFERLFKIILCLNFKENNKRLPKQGEIWNRKQGHDIEFLKSEVEKICIPVNRSFTFGDYDLITQDKDINLICKILSEFAKRSRYFNLDIILGYEQEFNSKKEWENIETVILKKYYGEKEFYKRIGNHELLDDVYLKLSELIVSKLELFLRALVRQFIFGNFSKGSKTYMITISSFFSIDDNLIGKTDYRKINNNEIVIKNRINCYDKLS